MTDSFRLTACVAVENSVYHFDKAFSYLVPEGLTSCVKTGCRVLVPFPGTIKKQGFVLSLSQTSEAAGLKEISSVLDERPLLTGELARLAFL